MNKDFQAKFEEWFDAEFPIDRYIYPSDRARREGLKKACFRAWLAGRQFEYETLND